ncbi:hypothetical protein, partial [Burkholderia sp. MSh2]|uniref:hypothetical protein n=1 Tax=Burkholderia sp. MSh2 TaxID=1506588 RepID=UPI003FA4B73C
WAVGSGQQAAGSRQQAAGSRKQEAGSRKQAAGSRQQAAGSGQQATYARLVAGTAIARASRRAARHRRGLPSAARVHPFG